MILRKLFVFIWACLVASEAADCVAATNTEPQGTVGISVRALRVSDGDRRVEWQVVLTNCETHLILVSETAVKNLLCGAKLADAHGEVWHVVSTNRNSPPASTEKDHFMFIRANKTFEQDIETEGLESQSTRSKGLSSRPDSLEYRFDTTITITDPTAKKDFVYRCLGTGTTAVDRLGQAKGK